MVGLSIAHQLIERGITRSVTILDKEPELGLHSSGRNSGVRQQASTTSQVLSRPKSALKALGASLWVEERGTLNPAGRRGVRAELDAQLDVLAERGKAMVPRWVWDADQLLEMVLKPEPPAAAL